MKNIFVSLTAVLICALLSFGAAAAGSALTLEAFAEENEIVLHIDISGNSQLCTTEFYIQFDADALEFKQGSEAAGNAVKELSPYITANVVSDGVLKIGYTCTEALAQGGELCSVTFKPLKDAAVHFTPEIEHAETFDGEHIRSINLNAEGCSVQVTKPALSAAVIALVAVGAAAVIAVTVIVIKKRKV